jgi:hypothetical protein
MPVCNADGTVTWKIEKISAGKGVVNEPIEAIFQIQGTPYTSQVGQYEPLLGETDLTGTDAFTNLPVSASDNAIDTSLPDDTTLGAGSGRVVQ